MGEKQAWEFPLPVNWQRVKLKHVCTLKGRLGWQNLRADEYTDEGPYLVTSEHFVEERVDWSSCYHVTQERYDMAPEIQLRQGDLLMMKDGAAMGKLAFVDALPGDACLNSHLLLFRPLKNSFLSRFLYHVLGTPIFRSFMVQERTGTTFFGISQESIESFVFSFPTVPVQYQIVAFLDRKTAEIDGMIAKKQRMIELLHEKRQALISEAVTKGLDPDLPTKGSGIEWLGRLPRHWSVLKLSFTAEIMNGCTPSRIRSDYWENGTIPWLSSGKVNDYLIESPSEWITEIALADCPLKLIPKGAVVVGMIGQGRTRGMSARLGIEACINQNMAAVITRPNLLLSEFLHYVLIHGYAVVSRR
jgi:type I restriction enzyme S subunit